MDEYENWAEEGSTVWAHNTVVDAKHDLARTYGADCVEGEISSHIGFAIEHLEEAEALLGDVIAGDDDE